MTVGELKKALVCYSNKANVQVRVVDSITQEGLHYIDINSVFLSFSDVVITLKETISEPG